MGVYVMGMKMPKNCEECDFATIDGIDFEYDLFCKCSKKYCDLDALGYPIGWNCPLIEVPTPHGRLIDADALNIAIEEDFDGVCVYDVSPYEAVNDMQSIVDRQPTIIEAEGD